MVTELASGGSLYNNIEQALLMQKLLKTKAATPEMKMPFDGIQATWWALQIAAGMVCLLSIFLYYRRCSELLQFSSLFVHVSLIFILISFSSSFSFSLSFSF
jgi:uncharacterized integral membrane protein